VTALRSRISIVNVFWIALLVHLDWHVGRGRHLRLSMESSWHWLIAVFGFACVWFCTPRKESDPNHRRMVTSVVAGLFAGQVIEPLGEIVFYGDSLREVYASGRWTIFLEFAAAGLATLGVLMLWSRRLQRTQSSIA
jgi:hypothetical protein